MNYYIGDPHYGHAAAIQFDARPFSDVVEMDHIMAQLWNSRVTDKDDVYIVGDLALKYTPEQVNNLVKSLKGKKHLIRGNHDHYVDKNGFDSSLFVWIKDYHRLTENDKKIVLCHYPMAVWDCSHHGSLHLYAHVHTNYEAHPILWQLENAYNTFVGLNGYMPCSLQEIIANNKAWAAKHGRR